MNGLHRVWLLVALLLVGACAGDGAPGPSEIDDDSRFFLLLEAVASGDPERIAWFDPTADELARAHAHLDAQRNAPRLKEEAKALLGPAYAGIYVDEDEVVILATDIDYELDRVRFELAPHGLRELRGFRDDIRMRFAAAGFADDEYRVRISQGRGVYVSIWTLEDVPLPDLSDIPETAYRVAEPGYLPPMTKDLG